MPVNVLSVLVITTLFVSITNNGCKKNAGPQYEPSKPRQIVSLCGDDWKVASLESGKGETLKVFKTGYPDTEAISAKVPGDVHWDLERASILPNLYYGTNSKLVSDIPRKDWWYKKVFTLSPEWENKSVRLHFDAVDYAAKVWLNGEFLGQHEGQFTPFEFLVTDKVKYNEDNELIVLVEAGPQNVLDALFQPVNQENRQFAMDEVSRTLGFWKCRTMTGWDWGTPMYTMGIWQDVYLTATNQLYLNNLTVLPELSPPYDRAILNIEMDITTDASTTVELVSILECITATASTTEARQSVDLLQGNNTINFKMTVESPRLWYPNGAGPQNLYALKVTALNIQDKRPLDNITKNLGIRHLEILPNPGQEEPMAYTDYWATRKDDAFSPYESGRKQTDINMPRKYLVKINGKPIFSRGGNWLPPDLIYGRIDYAMYQHLIRMAVIANYNTFRMWGGGLIEKQSFYDLCDIYGIMVWQEMPYAGRRPLETKPILSNNANQQRQVMKLLINHPCIVRYGFGNELYIDRNTSSQMAQFEDICKELDPTRLACGPDPVANAQRHGPHWFYFPEDYTTYNTNVGSSVGPDNPIEWTEYGASGASCVETLKRIIPDKNLWPINDNDVYWRWHNAIYAYVENTWLMPSIYESLFGNVPDLETMVRASQLAQAEGLRYANQSHRRNLWHRSGCVSWTFNEPWPNAAHGCIVEYYGQPKMAFYYAHNSYRNVDVSAEYSTMYISPDEPLQMKLFVTSDLSDAFEGCKLNATVIDLAGKVYQSVDWTLTIPPKTFEQVDTLLFTPPPQLSGTVFLVQLVLQDSSSKSIATNTYTFGMPYDWSNETNRKVPAVSNDGRVNLALQLHAKASAKSVIEGYDAHKVENLNDGWYGNRSSWIQGAPNDWAEIDLGTNHLISRVVVSNDNTMQFQDRGATIFQVLTATEYNMNSAASSWKTAAEYHDKALSNICTFDFETTEARWIRIDLPNSSGVRIDEIQIYASDTIAENKRAKVSQTAVFGPKPVDTKHAREYLKPLLNAPKTQLHLSLSDTTEELWANVPSTVLYVTVTNRGHVPSLFTELSSNLRPQQLYIVNNYFTLLPGQSNIVKIIMPEPNNSTTIHVNAKAWNSQQVSTQLDL